LSGIHPLLRGLWIALVICRTSNISQAGRIFGTPASSPSVPSLDAVFTECWRLLRRAELLLSSTLTVVEDLEQLLRDAKLLNMEFSKWPSCLPEEWKPRTMLAKPKFVISGKEFGWLPGRADVYCGVGNKLDKPGSWRHTKIGVPC
jgi:hypothetical protein